MEYNYACIHVRTCISKPDRLKFSLGHMSYHVKLENLEFVILSNIVVIFSTSQSTINSNLFTWLMLQQLIGKMIVAGATTY